MKNNGHIIFDRLASGFTQTDTPSGTTKPIVADDNGQLFTEDWTASGETNTASNLGSGLANFSGKSGVDLQFNSFNASDFGLASNVISIDATLKSTWNAKQGTISLTTVGTSGTATFNGTTLNIPNYTISGAALTKTDDTNVTLTLGGAPSTALLQATSLTLGWSGQLSLARGGTGASLSDPNANTLMAWDDTDGAVKFITIGSNLSYDHATHTLSATGGGGSGTVTSFTFTDANGFDGTVSNSTNTPTLSLTTTITDKQVMFSNNGAISGDTAFTWDSSANKLYVGFISDQGASALQVDGGGYLHNSTIVSGGAAAGSFISDYTINAPSLTAGAGIMAGFNAMTLTFTGDTTVAATDTWSSQFNRLTLGSTTSSAVTINTMSGKKRAISATNTQVVFPAIGGGISTTVGEVSSLRVQSPLQTTGSNWVTATNYYALFIEDLGQQLVNTAFVPNRWAIYQEGVSDANYLAGDTTFNKLSGTGTRLIGADSTGKLTAPTIASGKALANNTNSSTTPAEVGVWMYLTSGSTAGASTIDIDFSNYYTIYDELEVTFANIKPATDATALWMRTSTDASTYASGSTDYKYEILYGAGGVGTGHLDGSAGAAQILLGNSIGNGSANQNILTIRIPKPNNSAVNPMYEIRFGYRTNTGAITSTVNFAFRATSQITKAIRLLAASGNIVGTYAVKGIVWA